MKLDLDKDARMKLRMKAICDYINDRKAVFKEQITQQDVLQIFQTCDSILSEKALKFFLGDFVFKNENMGNKSSKGLLWVKSYRIVSMIECNGLLSETTKELNVGTNMPDYVKIAVLLNCALSPKVSHHSRLKEECLINSNAKQR